MTIEESIRLRLAYSELETLAFDWVHQIRPRDKIEDKAYDRINQELKYRMELKKFYNDKKRYYEKDLKRKQEEARM